MKSKKAKAATKRGVVSAIGCSAFPNPLCVRFGEGRILMRTFKDADGHGVVLRDSGEPHPVGMKADRPEEKNAQPKRGEIYLHFANAESALALRETIDEAIAEMSNPEVRRDSHNGGK